MSATAIDTAATFTLPDLGEGLSEAELVSWRVGVGENVSVDQVVAEVETAKALVEVPTPYAGTVLTLHASEGETVEVGSALITVGEPGGTEAEDTASESAEPEGSGNVLIGYGTSGEGAGGRRRRRRSQQLPGAAAQEAAVPDAARVAPRVVNPLVRRLAREHGVDLSALVGSGPDATVMRADVQAAIADAAKTTGTPQDAAEDAGEDARTGLGVASRKVLGGTRKAIAAAMERSRKEIPEATVWLDVDVTELLRLRAAVAKDEHGRRPSVLSLVGRFVCAGLERVPELNARLEERENGERELVTFDGVNLGIAVDSDRGLVVPAVRRAERMDARGLDAAIASLAEEARAGRSSVSDLRSGTFTLNNYGVLGVDGSAAIINHPQVAILGMGRIMQRPWVVDGELAVRDVTELTLTFDHRVCDGGTASTFLRFVADAMQRPGEALVSL